MADQSTPMIFQNGSIVGIGTGSPSIGKLHVEGTAYASVDLQAGTDIRMLRSGTSPAFVISNNTDLRWVNNAGGTITMTIGSGSVSWGGAFTATTSVTSAALDISGSSLLGVVKHTQSPYRIYRNLTRFDNYNNGTGAIAIYTTIPWSAANMLTIQVKGYQYGGGGPFDIICGVYAGEGNFYNPGYTASNDYFGEYYWARDSNNYVVLILGSTAGVYGAQVWVSEYKQGFGGLSTSYADGWSMAKITSTTGLSTVTSIPSRQVVKATTGSFGGAVTMSSTLNVSGNLTTGGNLYVPGGGQIVINNEASTWAYINRTNTPSTTFLGAQLKNIISCGGGGSEGLAVGPNGVAGVTNYSAFEVNNFGAGYFRSSLSVGTTATTFTGEFATSLRVGGGTYASTSCRIHFSASTQYGQIIEHNPGAGSEGDAYDTLFLVQTYDSASAKATIGFSCNSGGQHHRAIIQAYRDTSGGSGASGRMDIKMRDNSANYSTAIGIRSSLASAFYGAITSTGDITAYSSDSRLKENVVEIENAVDKVSQIRGVTFTWKPEAEKLGLKIARKDEVGVLAQEIQAVLPEAVSLAPFDQSDEDPLVSKSGENYLTVKYEKIVPLLIEAIKEQQATIASLEARINRLES